MNLTSLGTSRLFIRYFLVQFYGFPLTFKLQKKLAKELSMDINWLFPKQKDFLLALINGKPYIFLLRLQGRNRVGRVGKPSALQMMPIEMEIGRREGVTFVINSLGNTANEKKC